MQNAARSIRIYDKNASGEAAAVLVDSRGEHLLFKAASITQIRNQLGQVKRQHNLIGVKVDTLIGQSFSGVSNLLTFPTLVPPVVEPLFSVNERFEMAADILDTMLHGSLNATVLCGRGGTGKTATVLAQIEAAGFQKVSVTSSVGMDDFDEEEGDEGETRIFVKKSEGGSDRNYVYIKGALAPTELYKLLYNHRNDLVVFDDCDSALGCATRINILKAVLDTYDVREVTWLSPYLAKEGYPSNFIFEGKVVFVSNLKLEQIPQAIKSRSMMLNLDMTNLELVERATAIADKLMPALDDAARALLIEFATENCDSFKDFSLRTFQNAQPLMGKANWKNLVRFAL